MLISIFSPTKDRATTFLPQLLESIESQILPFGWSLEWVVCDDGSDKQDLEILRALLSSAKVATVLIEHHTSRGVSESRNAAFKACKGEYILDVDDDDLLTRDAVMMRVNHLIATDSLWSFTDAACIDESGRIKIGKELLQGWKNNSLSKQEILDLLLCGKAWFWASTRTYRKGALGGGSDFISWDPKYIVAQDLDHWIKLTDAIGPPVHLNAITVYWRGKQYSHGVNGMRSGLQAEMIADIRSKWPTSGEQLTV